MTPPPPPSQDSSTPFWSVMIPAHHPDPAYLQLTIQSILDAGIDPRRDQCAILLDGPVHHAIRPLLDRAAQRGIEIHLHSQPLGLVGNWNACLDHARGQWIHILHQDDSIDPAFYRTLEDGIRTHPHIGAAYTQTLFIDADGHPLRTGHMPQSQPGIVNDWIQHILVNLTVQCPSIVVRRDVYHHLGPFNPAFAYCPDADMWARIASDYPIWYDPRPLARYRIHPHSATAQLFSLRTRRREIRRCLRAALPRLSPVIRPAVRKTARHYQTRLAWAEWREAWRATPRLATLFNLPLSSTPGNLLAIRNRRYPPPLPSRPPLRHRPEPGPRTPRILLLSEFFPHPPDRAIFGVYQRLLRTTQGLTQAGALDAIFFWGNNHRFPPEQQEDFRNQLQPAWPELQTLTLIPITSGPHSELRQHPLRAIYWMLRGVSSFMNNHPTLRCCTADHARELRHHLLRLQPDLILAHRTGPAGALLRSRIPCPPVLLDFDDIDHIKIARIHDRSHPLKTFIWSLLARNASRTSARFATQSFVCSETDRDALRSLAPRASIQVVPNTARAVPPLPPSPHPVALFVGIAHYPPNREAILWFAHQVWPAVKAAIPSATFLVVGEGSSGLLQSSPHLGIEVIDFAPDLTPHYQRASLCLCPIRQGSGTRIKIIEAAFHARAIVSTTIGAEGLHFQPGTEILIADTPASFADACIHLLQHPDQRNALASAARQRAESLYHPDLILRQISATVTRLLHPAT